MRRFILKLANFFRRERADREMTREMAAHLALIEDDLMRRGMSAREARLAAASKAVEAVLPKDAANVGATYYLADGSKAFDAWRTRLHDPLVILMGPSRWCCWWLAPTWRTCSWRAPTSAARNSPSSSPWASAAGG
jgi:hypothetical protein